MIGSLLIKLGMLALTMGVILWIGWTVPEEHNSEGEPVIDQGQTLNVERAETAIVTTATTGSASRVADQPKNSLKSRPAGTLDLNRATEQDFESLPGIGTVLAGRIVEYRQGIGSFRNVEDLREVKGIGKKKFDRIRKLVHVTIPMQPAKEGKKTT